MLHQVKQGSKTRHTEESLEIKSTREDPYIVGQVDENQKRSCVACAYLQCAPFTRMVLERAAR